MKNKSLLLSALLAILSAGLSLQAQDPARPPLLAAGAVAPDFTARRADNSFLKLSDFRGQVVLVDFWATWCGPCKAAMPHMEKVHQQLKDQGLVVLGVCVWDKRSNFDIWLAEPPVPTSYQKVFDPAGRDNSNIAQRLYRVSGIPTFYLIDKEGKVVFAGVGSGRQTEAALNKALASVGFKL